MTTVETPEIGSFMLALRVPLYNGTRTREVNTALQRLAIRLLTIDGFSRFDIERSTEKTLVVMYYTRKIHSPETEQQFRLAINNVLLQAAAEEETLLPALSPDTKGYVVIGMSPVTQPFTTLTPAELTSLVLFAGRIVRGADTLKTMIDPTSHAYDTRRLPHSGSDDVMASEGDEEYRSALDSQLEKVEAFLNELRSKDRRSVPKCSYSWQYIEPRLIEIAEELHYFASVFGEVSYASLPDQELLERLLSLRQQLIFEYRGLTVTADGITYDSCQ